MGRTVLLLALASIGGCGGAQDQKTAVAPKSYEMRGMVRQISPPEAEERQIWIHHEAVSDFVDIRGNTAPMDAMTMPFHLTDSVDLAGIEPGNRVSFRLDVDWGASLPARIARLEILPDETRLDFEEDSAAEPDVHGEH